MIIFVLLSRYSFKKENTFSRLGFPALPPGMIAPLGMSSTKRIVLNKKEKLPDDDFDLYFIDVDHEKDDLLRMVNGISNDCALILHNERSKSKNHRYLFTHLSNRLSEKKILYRYEHSNDQTFKFITRLTGKTGPEYEQLLKEYKSSLMEDAIMEIKKEIEKSQHFRSMLCKDWLEGDKQEKAPYLYKQLFAAYPALPDLIRTTAIYPYDSAAYREAARSITLLIG